MCSINILVLIHGMCTQQSFEKNLLSLGCGWPQLAQSEKRLHKYAPPDKV